MAAARLLLLGSLVALAYGQPTSRILGGENAETTGFPYAASVRLDNAHVCGGTIITAEHLSAPQHILTAAHCVTEKDGKAIDSDRLSVRVGSTNQYAGGRLVEVNHVTIHPDYDDLKNDLAILTLTASLPVSERISAVPYAKTLAETPADDAKVVIAGWGEQTDGVLPHKLQHTTLSVANEADCTDAFSGNDDSVICFNHKLKQGTCRGDAGNGAVHDGTLVAVSNFIIGACGARYPDVYGNVAYFGKWIDSVLAEEI